MRACTDFFGFVCAGFADDEMDDEDDEEFLQNMARQEAARQVGFLIHPCSDGLAATPLHLWPTIC